jgi:transposase-like protein
MSINQVQFQKGLSLDQFIDKYGTEDACRTAVLNAKWPTGFQCPECGCQQSCQLTRGQYQCNQCHHQTSLTVGTIFQGTKLPLRKWFLAMYLLTQHKKGVSALQLSRDLGVNYKTAWSVKHKLMQTMLERQQDKKLQGRIEMDDAYLGGERSGKRGRGSENKMPFIAAVETTDDGKPVQIHLRRVNGFRTKEIEAYANASLMPNSHVISDGLACFVGVAAAGFEHTAIVTGGGKGCVQIEAFRWVNTLLGNVKNALTGTYHAIRKQHASRYLAEFEYRFNRRYDLPSMLDRLLFIAVKTPSMPYRFLKIAECYG